jgi:hypothetical protein
MPLYIIRSLHVCCELCGPAIIMPEIKGVVAGLSRDKENRQTDEKSALCTLMIVSLWKFPGRH